MRLLQSNWARSDVPSGGAASPAPAPSVPAGGAAWGGISGTIASQADLQTALSGKEASITAGGVGQYWRGDKTWQTLSASTIGLGNVTNTSDVNKPVSTAQQAALDLKANLTDLTTLGAITATMGVSLVKGQPVVIDLTTGKFLLADSVTRATSLVIGLLSATASSGASGTAVNKIFTLADWTAITGTVLLTPGANYFLQLGGGLGISPTGVCVVLIGIAISTTTLLLDIKPPILL